MQHKLNSLPKSTYMCPKISGDVRKSCAELAPASQFMITTLSATER